MYTHLVADRQKEIRWVGSALDDIRALEMNAKREAGYQLYRVQIGLMPDDFKPMPDIGRGVFEIRVRTGREHRVFYVATSEEAVYVLHVFEKKSRKTRQSDIEIGRARFATVTRCRQSG